MQIGVNVPTTAPLIEPDRPARIIMEGRAQTREGTIGNMHRFRDGVLSKLA